MTHKRRGAQRIRPKGKNRKKGKDSKKGKKTKEKKNRKKGITSRGKT